MLTNVFWALSGILLLCASLFLIPPIWLSAENAYWPPKKQLTYSSLLVLLLVLGTYFLYRNLGAAAHLTDYYSFSYISERQNYKLIRPLYARMQRELVKNQLDLNFGLENLDLILNFAQIHSKAQSGVLQPEIQQLLQAVLKAAPQQITALNLLAVNAYKTEQYSQAIEYWERILQQFTPAMRNSNLEQILQDKIAATRNLASKKL